MKDYQFLLYISLFSGLSRICICTDDSRHCSFSAASHQLTNTYIRTRSFVSQKLIPTRHCCHYCPAVPEFPATNNATPSDTPALVLLTEQTSESAGVLALTQQRLSPPKITSPESQRAETVKTAHPVSESRPLPSPTIVANFSRLIITGKPGSAPVTLSPTARNRTVGRG